MRRTKENIKYGLKSLNKRKILSIFLIMQITASVFIMCFVLTNYYDSKNVLQHINKYMNGKNIYTLYNIDTYNLVEEKGEKIAAKKYKKVYSDLRKEKVERILVSNAESIGDENGKELNTFKISPNFFEKYDIKIADFNRRIDKTFKLRHGNMYKVDEVPVYAGNFWRKKYGLNKMIKTDIGVNFKIVGFLESGQRITLPMQRKESTSIDDAILIPYYLDFEDNFMEYLESLQFIAKDKKEIQGVINALNQEKIVDYYFKNYKDQLRPIREDYINLYALHLSLGVILAVFSIISIIGMIIQVIEDSEYEYGVSMMCGARKSDIFVRLLTQIICMFILGIIVLYTCFGVTKASNNIMIGVSVLFGIVTIYSLKKINTGEIIKKIKSE